MKLSQNILDLDTDETIEKISIAIRNQIINVLHRRGAVVGISGGIDSSVCAALCVRALGKEKVFGIFMPEKVSSSDSLAFGKLLSASLGIQSVTEDIAPILQGAGCYERQLEALREVFPECDMNWKFKVTIPSILESDRLNVLRLVVELPNGTQKSARMPLMAYLKLIAATNWKQRVRAAMEYYHADRLNFAVCGTPNRLEYDQGFFVKGGDGAADFKPIAHLYKTQVYMLAEALGIPKEIRSRPPTTDTYSLSQTQEEFYFALPYHKMDLCLYGFNHGFAAKEIAPVVDLTEEQIERVYKDIESKRRGTHYMHLAPLLVEPIKEITKD